MRRKTIEDYVELIYVIQKEKDIVHTNDIAESLKINPASVTEIFQKLNNEGYIDYKKYSGVKLTKKGKKLALNTKKKHETLKNFLIILGIDENIANEDACKIEHILNPKTMIRLTKFVEFVQSFKGEPRWLERFDHYYRTGEHFKCDCPISEI
jgi:DtxR family Mn-dependent transcriptional regulator